MSGWKVVSDQKSDAGAWVISDADGNETDSGTDGLASLASKFVENQVQFAAIRVCGVDEQENVTSTRPKIVRINWVGKKVPAMKKMSALQGKQKMSDLWNGCAVEVEANTQDDLTMKAVGVELLRCGGAHKPTHYDFGDDKIPLSDCKN
mmetsp:Transcript_11165/g.16021  ORF Transcript_11165/g.16021 Transcript_11165/m.16021 type:complete len:149 (+) Transcript_11165:39-485(+)|eukprot:CAMPEP_0175099632 /NCGR_PEP_ID=MMETSP0086_2-20121207/6574_1 /TAXON_ID=136419 /ORGANISM="Unknown Unknown, Strain D1" /LENGTH=148 /DNA_ID=CAMNT_0016373523 /DNA_START=44 /DNA_END=490 /DNA_ORIENTATION=-